MVDGGDEKGQETEEDAAVPRRLLLLFVAGFVLVFIGVLVIMVATAVGGSGSASSGVVIFIGPFPVAFGAGPDAAWLILIGIILAVVSVMVFMVMRKKLGGIVV